MLSLLYLQSMPASFPFDVDFISFMWYFLQMTVEEPEMTSIPAIQVTLATVDSDQTDGSIP
jgi:hypothetical protein